MPVGIFEQFVVFPQNKVNFLQFMKILDDFGNFGHIDVDYKTGFQEFLSFETNISEHGGLKLPLLVLFNLIIRTATHKNTGLNRDLRLISVLLNGPGSYFFFKPIQFGESILDDCIFDFDVDNLDLIVFKF